MTEKTNEMTEATISSLESMAKETMISDLPILKTIGIYVRLIVEVLENFNERLKKLEEK